MGEFRDSARLEDDNVKEESFVEQNSVKEEIPKELHSTESLPISTESLYHSIESLPHGVLATPPSIESLPRRVLVTPVPRSIEGNQEVVSSKNTTEEHSQSSLPQLVTTVKREIKRKEFSVIVKSAKVKTLKINVHGAGTVKKVKKTYCRKVGLSSEIALQFLKDGEVLEDDTQIKDVGDIKVFAVGDFLPSL